MTPLRTGFDGTCTARGAIVRKQTRIAPSRAMMKGAEGGIALRDGTHPPPIGFGTYKVGFIPASASAAAAGSEAAGATGRTAAECVADALDVGYRFLDCAEFYGEWRAIRARGLRNVGTS